MTGLLWCVVIGVVLPYVAHVGVMLARWMTGRYDNREPRRQSMELTGFGGRAWAAQQNAWEAITVFAPVALVATWVGVDATAATIAGAWWVACRVGHLAAYLADAPRLRSAMFFLANLSVIGLVVLAATS